MERVKRHKVISAAIGFFVLFWLIGTCSGANKQATSPFAYLSAQNDGDSGSVTCKILHDGKEWKVSTSTAPYGIASCSGTVGF